MISKMPTCLNRPLNAVRKINKAIKTVKKPNSGRLSQYAKAPMMETLESRVLLSADSLGSLSLPIVEHVETSHVQIVETWQDSGETKSLTDTKKASENRQEIVFIAPGVEDYQSLFDDITGQQREDRQYSIHLLDNNNSVIEQISNILSEQNSLDAIHLVSHGKSGELSLGSDSLNLDTIQHYQNALSDWQHALKPDADLLLYGCDLVSNSEDQTLVQQLSELTGADVTASDDITGSAHLGGDWTLEFNTGSIETSVAFSKTLQQSWGKSLAGNWYNPNTGASLSGPDNNANLYVGSTGNDSGMDGGDGQDVLFGADGNDHLGGDNDEDWLFGQAGDDHLDGDNHDDLLFGGLGNDQLHGKQHNDTIIGGGGSDDMQGDDGNDLFLFTGAQDGDIYTVDGGADTDTIDLSEFGATRVTQVNSSTIEVDLGGGAKFTINHSNTESIITADDTGVNHANTADAGSDQTVAINTLVTLDATGSSDLDNDPLTYQWQQISGSWVTLSDNTSATPTFTAPAISDTLEFAVVVSDGQTANVDFVQVKVSALVVTTNADELDNTPTTIANLVSSPGGSGISLREAISAIMSDPSAINPERIFFNIGGGGQQSIAVTTSALPEITKPVIIDATTQPGYVDKPLIELDGNAAGAAADGFNISAGNSTIRGFVINQFSDNGIELNGSSSNTIESNYIGTDKHGTSALANTGSGIYISDSSSNSILDNVMSGNASQGIEIQGSSSDNNTIFGNLIGTDFTGSSAMGNLLSGIYIFQGDQNIIGGTGSNEGNTIAHNGSDPFYTGIRIWLGTGNTVRGNSIHSNSGVGIDLGINSNTANDNLDADSGTNNLQNYPVITSVSVNGGNTTIEGSLNSAANITFNIDLYSSSTADSSGHGEGEIYLGSTTVITDISGDGTFSTIVPTALSAGEIVSATATDPSGNTSEFSANFAVVSVNQLPTVANVIPNQNATEDTGFSYQFPTNTFDDGDGDTLTYTSNASGWLSFDALTRTFTGTPLNADVGTTTVTVTADDSNTGIIADSFDIVISNTNDDPTVANSISNQVATEDSPFSFQFAANTFNDVDGDTLTYTSDASGWLSFDALTRTFTGTPLNADVGTTTVTVTADDSNTGIISDSFDIVISNTNDDPTVTNSIAHQPATEDIFFSFTFDANVFNDIDGDTLTYTASGLPTWMTFVPNTRTFTGTPTNADVGTTTITVTSDDGNLGTISDTFNVIVDNTNDDPTVANPILNQLATEDTPFNFQFATNTFSDIDVGDTLTYSSDASGWLSFDAATRTFSGTPLNADVGTTTVTVTADDGKTGIITDSFDIVIANTNDSPTVANVVADQTAVADTAFSFTFNANVFNDIDGDSLTYSTSELPTWLNFNAATRSFSGTPTNTDVGAYTITLRATDSSSAFTETQFTVTVSTDYIDPSINDQQFSIEEDALNNASIGTVQVDNTNPDSDLNFAILSGNSGATFAISTSTGEITLANADVLDYETQPQYSLVVQLSDNSLPGFATTASITINIIPEDSELRITSTTTPVTQENSTPVITVLLDSDDNSALTPTFTISGGADADKFIVDREQGELSFISPPNFENPSDADADNIYRVELTVTDQNGFSVNQPMSVRVVNVNETPELSNDKFTIDNSNPEGTIIGQLTAQDPDANQTFTYSINNSETAELFTIDDQGQLSIVDKNKLHATDQEIFELDITVLDQDGLAATSKVTIQVIQDIQNKPIPPTVSNGTFGNVSVSANSNQTNEDSSSQQDEETATGDKVSEGAAKPFIQPVLASVNSNPFGSNSIQITTLGTNSQQSGNSFNSVLQERTELIKLPVKQINKIQPEVNIALRPIKSVISIISSDNFVRQLDELKQDVQDYSHLEKQVLGSSLIVSSGISVGYVIWLVRGGVLISSVLSSLPAWRMIDPLPVIGQMDDDQLNKDSDDSLESLIQQGSEQIEKQAQTEHSSTTQSSDSKQEQNS